MAHLAVRTGTIRVVRGRETSRLTFRVESPAVAARNIDLLIGLEPSDLVSHSDMNRRPDPE